MFGRKKEVEKDEIPVQYCYISDQVHVFTAVSYDRSTIEDGTVECKHLITNAESEIPVSFLDKFPISSIDEYYNPPSDLITLSDVHAASILNALRLRFAQDLVYTGIGPILVALNPFKWITNLYDDDIKFLYANKKRNMSDNPHVFGIAQEAFSGLHMGKDQSLIISGESGAGKTESTKQCLNFLAGITIIIRCIRLTC